jgi:hypothetical protein
MLQVVASVAVTVTLPVAPAAIEAGALRFSVTANRLWPASRKHLICVGDTSCQKMSGRASRSGRSQTANPGERKRRQIVEPAVNDKPACCAPLVRLGFEPVAPAVDSAASLRSTSPPQALPQPRRH